jgi:hypothetical protein
LLATLRSTVAAHGEREAYVGPGERRTWRDLHAGANRAAAALYVAGVRHGDHVGILLGNESLWIETFFGCAAIGAVAVPVNTRFKAEDLKYCLAQSDSKFLLMVDRFLNVDFNAMLVQAVRTDRKNEDTYDQTDEQQATYDADVAAMFGKDGGSKRYAPATMALLGQLGYQDNAGDLDDFLRLKAAVKEKDIKRLDLQGDMVNVPGQGQREVLGPQVQRQADGDVLNPVQYDRVQLAGTLAAKTSVLQEQLAKGTALLQTMNATAALDRNPRVELYGGKPNEPKVAAGFGAPADTSGTTTMDGYCQKAVENMADPQFDAASIYQTVKARATPEQFNAFLTFARAKAEQAKRYGVALSGAENARSPEEFTKLLATIGGGS